MAGTVLLEPSFLPPQIYISRRLEQAVEQGLKPRHWYGMQVSRHILSVVCKTGRAVCELKGTVCVWGAGGRGQTVTSILAKEGGAKGSGTEQGWMVNHADPSGLGETEGRHPWIPSV